MTTGQRRRAPNRLMGPGPFLKWAGGKGQLLDELLQRTPDEFGAYHEPFMGSGALFFALREAGRLTGDIHLSDANRHLVHTYLAVRDDVDAVIDVLKTHRYEKDYYYEVRALDPDEMGDAERAARFLFLNRTGFNGLYRENKSGKFNVPFGRYKNPTICPEDRLRHASAALQGVNIRREGFERSGARAQEGDFVYFDPPYLPVSKTSSFTAYNEGGFGEDGQRRLATVFHHLAARGVHVVLSNSSVPLIEQLYAGQQIDRVKAKRNINSKGNARGEIHEVIVTPGARAERSPREQLDLII